MGRPIRVLMCGSDIGCVKGGMVTVVKNYMEYDGWKNSELTYLATHTEGSITRKIFCFAKAGAGLFFQLLLGQYDLLHLHVAERGSFYRKALLVLLSHRLNVPVVLHHHGAEFEDFYARMNARQRAYVKRIFEMADCNLVLSGDLREQLLKKAPAAKVIVLYNAVKVSQEHQYRLEAQRIVMLGRQGWRKGSFDLLEAVAIINKELPEGISLWMCGDGDAEAIKRKARELGISERLAYVGWIGGDKKEACLEEAMVHVLPSYREGLPMSILETMERGIPNISTQIAAVPEIIQEGVNGFMMEPGDVKRLAYLLRLLAGDKQLRSRIGQEGRRKIIENFSLEKNIAELEDIYERIRKDACG